MQLLGNFRDFEIAKGGPFALSAFIRDLKISLIIAEMQINCKGGDPLHFSVIIREI